MNERREYSSLMTSDCVHPINLNELRVPRKESDAITTCHKDTTIFIVSLMEI